MNKSPKLTAKLRKSLPAKKMGLPKQNKYPVDTKARAIAAKAYARQELNKGNLTYAEYRQIVNKANITLGSPAGAK